MKVPGAIVVPAALIVSARAGNPANLRSSIGSDSSPINQFDFSDVNQAEQTATSLDGSGSEACVKTCSLDYEPVTDNDGVEYFNECLLRLAQCSEYPYLSVPYMSDVRDTFDARPGTIALVGSGSTEHLLIDDGLDELFGSYSPREDGKGLLESLADAKPVPMRSGLTEEEQGKAKSTTTQS